MLRRHATKLVYAISVGESVYLGSSMSSGNRRMRSSDSQSATGQMVVPRSVALIIGAMRHLLAWITRALECLGEILGVVASGTAVKVTLGGGEVRVTHPFLDFREVEIQDRGCAESVAEVMEATDSNIGGLLGFAETLGEHGAVHEVAVRSAEDEVVAAAPAPAAGDDLKLLAGSFG